MYSLLIVKFVQKRVCPETVVQYIFSSMSFLQECFTQNIPISFLLMFELFVVVIVFQQKYNWTKSETSYFIKV